MTLCYGMIGTGSTTGRFVCIGCTSTQANQLNIKQIILFGIKNIDISFRCSIQREWRRATCQPTPTTATTEGTNKRTGATTEGTNRRTRSDYRADEQANPERILSGRTGEPFLSSIYCQLVMSGDSCDSRAFEISWFSSCDLS